MTLSLNHNAPFPGAPRCVTCNRVPWGRFYNGECGKCWKTKKPPAPSNTPSYSIGDLVTWRRARISEAGKRIGSDYTPVPCKVVGVGVGALVRIRDLTTGTDHNVLRKSLTPVVTMTRKLSDAEVTMFLKDRKEMSNKEACQRWGISESHGSSISRGRARRTA